MVSLPENTLFIVCVVGIISTVILCIVAGFFLRRKKIEKFTQRVIDSDGQISPELAKTLFNLCEFNHVYVKNGCHLMTSKSGVSKSDYTRLHNLDFYRHLRWISQLEACKKEDPTEMCEVIDKILEQMRTRLGQYEVDPNERTKIKELCGLPEKTLEKYDDVNKYETLTSLDPSDEVKQV